MKKEIAIFVLLQLSFISLLTTCDRKSSSDGSNLKQKKEQSHLYSDKTDSFMKIRDLIILVKYAQGLVVFNSFFDYVRHMSEEDRKKFLSQTAMLINKLDPQDSDIVAALKKSEISTDSKQFEMLLDEGLSASQVENLLKFQDEDLQATLKLLMQIFTEVYKKAYEANKDNEGVFWYWDYSDPATAFKVVELDTKQAIDINNF